MYTRLLWQILVVVKDTLQVEHKLVRDLGDGIHVVVDRVGPGKHL